MVTSCTRMLAKACPQIVRPNDSPFTRAVVMYSWFSWSSMKLRVIRVM